MDISQSQFLEASGIKQSGFLPGVLKSSWVSNATDFLILGDGKIYSDIGYADLQKAKSKGVNKNVAPLIDFALKKDIFSFISSLDGGGTVVAASTPDNWSLNETLTAGAFAITRQANRLSTVDVRKWAMLDGNERLSEKDNEIAERLMKQNQDKWFA